MNVGCGLMRAVVCSLSVVRWMRYVVRRSLVLVCCLVFGTSLCAVSCSSCLMLLASKRISWSLVVGCLSIVVRSVMFVVWCVFPNHVPLMCCCVCCLLLFVCCLWYIVCCSLMVDRCLLLVVCGCLLFAVC